MGYCSCGNWVDEGSICTHCGSALTYEEPDDDEDIDDLENYIGRSEYFYRQARTCSIKGNHSAAIGFYNEALKDAYGIGEKCEMLSSIAEEYEKIGDYDSAETYWQRCCRADVYGRYLNGYKYLAGKGDFLCRRGRYEEAIGDYENALKSLDAMKGRQINAFKLKDYAVIVRSITDSYNRLGRDNLGQKYQNQLKRAVDRFKESRVNKEFEARYLSEAAWQLYEDDGLPDEALILIDAVIDLYPDGSANDYNRKAIILEKTRNYDGALKYYDMALARDSSDEIFLNNKAACIREKLKDRLLSGNIKTRDLDLINEALKILPESYDNRPYLFTKAEILNKLGDPVKAKVCNALAVKNYDEVDEVEKQLKKLKPNEKYINITATQYYRNFAPFKEGVIVDLIREPDNPHDRDAIRAEINGETVGYVANSRHTLIKEVKSATDIKYTSPTQAEVQFILFGEWVVAKLIYGG